MKPAAVRREIPDGEVRGLYLQIFPSGKASWCFRYRFARRTRKLTIGLSPEIGLKDARDLARKAHLTVADGPWRGRRPQIGKSDIHELLDPYRRIAMRRNQGAHGRNGQGQGLF